MHFFGVVLHLLGDVQNVGKDHLGNRVGAIGRDVGDDDAMFFGSMVSTMLYPVASTPMYFNSGSAAMCSEVSTVLLVSRISALAARSNTSPGAVRS